MNNVIIKRSNLGYMPFPTSDNFVIRRALTVKEAFTKASKTDQDCLIIEGATDADLTTATELLDKMNIKDTLVVLLSEPSVELDNTLLNKVRAQLMTNSQLVWNTGYEAGKTYDDVFKHIEDVWIPAYLDSKNKVVEEATATEGMTTQQQEEERDLTIVGQVAMQTATADSEVIIQLQYQLASLTEELRIAKDFIEEMTENPAIDVTKAGGAESARLYEENNSLREEITRLTELQTKFDELNATIENLNVRHSYDKQLTGMWKTLVDGIFDYSKEIEDLKEQAQRELSNAAEAAGTTKQKIVDMQNKIDEQDETIAKLSELNATQQTQIAVLHVDLKTAVESGEKLQSRCDDLDNILLRLQEEKRTLSADLSKAQAEIAQLSTYDVTQLREMAKDGGNVQQILEEKMRTAKEALRNTESKNRQLSKELANSRTVIESLTREKRILEGMLDGENYGGAALSWLVPVQARVWSFIGHGGQGCTTTAHAVANRIFEAGKSVCIVDCDFRAPKMHVLCKVDPCIAFTKFTNIGTELRTSLGKLLTNGANCYTDFEREMIIPVRSEGHNRLDLISGLLSVRAASEVASLDLNTLCVELAKKYDYIIIDLGRAEGNGGIARQQSIIMKNSNRRFVVTTNDLENVKSAVNRLIQAGIDVDNTEFVFDLVIDKPDKNLEQITRRVRHVWEIPMNKSMIGKSVPLATNNNIIKQLVAQELGK